MAELHIVPTNDVIEHEAEDCACGPETEFLEGIGHWLSWHHALDGRQVPEPERTKDESGKITLDWGDIEAGQWELWDPQGVTTTR